VPLCIHAAEPLYTFIFRQFHPSFYQLSLVRLIVSFLILIVPATLMGGTLPVITKFIAGTFGGTPAKQAGRLYAANTFGAVIGSLASGYFLIGTVGLIGTTAIAAFVNFSIATAVMIYCKRSGGLPDTEKGKSEPILTYPRENDQGGSFKRAQVGTVIALYALCGFLSLFLEVAWTRALVWVMGMDAYAFASMLAVFLFGLALGSCLVSWFMQKGMHGAILKLGIIQLLIGLSVIFSAILIDNLYGFMHNFDSFLPPSSYWGSFAFLIAIAAVIMAIPSLLMGMAFPLALRISLNGRPTIGAGVGAIYAANTIGSVFGSLAAGFVSLPLVGVMKSIVIAGAAFLLIAAVLLTTAGEYRKIAANSAALVLAAASLILLFAWAPSLKDALARGLGPDNRLIYFKETVTGDVEVTQSGSEGKMLKIDGRQVAGDGATDLPSHRYPAHLTSLLVNHPKTALIVAFGAGGTSGSILQYNELERLDVVEICGGVVEPARKYFSAMNYGVLDDPRLHLIIQDGKNYVKLTDKTYDIIFSGPIHPQSNQGSAALYTRDFFEDCRKRLNKGGVQCLWLPMHMPPEDYKVIVKTFQQVYPHSSLWLIDGSPNTSSHTHLIGSIDPLAIDFNLVNEKLRESAVMADIDQCDYFTLSDGFDFIGQYALGEDNLREFTSDVKASNTDNLPVAEFFRKIGRKTYARNRECPALLLADILRYKENTLPKIVDVSASDTAGLAERFAEYCKGDSLRIRGHICTIMSNVVREKLNPSEDDMKESFHWYTAACRNYTLATQYLPNDRFMKEYLLEASKLFSQGN